MASKTFLKHNVIFFHEGKFTETNFILTVAMITVTRYQPNMEK